MEPKKYENDYEKYLFESSFKDSIHGSVLAIISFTLFIFADRFIFMYPVSITNLRIVMVVLFTFYLGLALNRRNIDTRIYKYFYMTAIGTALTFSTFLNLVMYISRPEYTARAVQVSMAVTIGCVLFAGPIRDYINRILVINISAFFTILIIIDSFSSRILFEFYNMILFTIAMIVFNRYYSKSLYQEFVVKRKLENKLSELEEEIEAKEVLEEELTRIAVYDEMTNFYSRSAGLRLFEQTFSNAKLNKMPLSVCFMDLDNLKLINDIFGHPAGDQYIKDFSDMIKLNTRASDLCIRMGGDEFLLVLPHVDQEKTEEIWDFIKDGMEYFNETQKKPYTLSASHGIAEFPIVPFQSTHEMIEFADNLMYDEKIKKKMVL